MIDTIIVPQGAEYRAVKAGLNKLSATRPLVIDIPIGGKNIEQTLASKNFWQPKPQQVLMMGLCGSLSPKFSVGEAILYQNCCIQPQKYQASDRDLNLWLERKISSRKTKLPVVSGLTSDRIVTTTEEKRQFAKRFTASVVDMESYYYLKLLQEQNVAVSILRIVSDDVRYDLPNLERAISKEGKIKPWIMFAQAIEKPLASLIFIRGSLKGLQQLKQITTKIFSDR